MVNFASFLTVDTTEDEREEREERRRPLPFSLSLEEVELSSAARARDDFLRILFDRNSKLTSSP